MSLETNGIGYILHVANPYTIQVGVSKAPLCAQVVREDSSHMDFARAEKALSQSDFGIWIGPVSALAIIAATN